MAKVRLSKRAERDVLEIYEWTAKRWGQDQADKYHTGLSACFDKLAARNILGRPFSVFGRNYLVYHHERHMIFFRVEPDGAMIVRVLHDAMDPQRRL